MWNGGSRVRFFCSTRDQLANDYGAEFSKPKLQELKMQMWSTKDYDRLSSSLWSRSALSLILYQKITEVCDDGDEIAGHQRESAGQDITNVTS